MKKNGKSQIESHYNDNVNIMATVIDYTGQIVAKVWSFSILQWC